MGRCRRAAGAAIVFAAGLAGCGPRDEPVDASAHVPQAVQLKPGSELGATPAKSEMLPPPPGWKAEKR